MSCMDLMTSIFDAIKFQREYEWRLKSQRWYADEIMTKDKNLLETFQPGVKNAGIPVRQRHLLQVSSHAAYCHSYTQQN
jgi:hypothetical protein